MPSLAKAQQHFVEYGLPRRTRDYVAEEIHRNKADSSKVLYRRVAQHERDRGSLYPVYKAGFSTFAHFGIGIGLYFTQLIVLIATTFTCCLVMFVSSSFYNKESYGSHRHDGFLRVTATCDSYKNVTATVNCDNDLPSCQVKYIENCDIDRRIVICDLVMCVIFIVCIALSYFLERMVVKKLDEEVQTAQDYSVEVLDPPEDADNPDEWRDYFNRFGVVRYVTIVRNNNSLLSLLLKRRKYEKRREEISRRHSKTAQTHSNERSDDETNRTYRSNLNFIKKRLSVVQKKLEKEYLKSFGVTRVYVTFEFEEHQRLCLQALEVPDYQAIFDIRDRSRSQVFFRGKHVLNVKEPAEPENILWENLATKPRDRSLLTWLSFGISFGLLVLSWFVIDFTQNTSPGFLAVTIGVIDALLPSILEALTNMTCPLNYGVKLSSLQVKLFAARLLLSTVVPYIQTQWDQVLSSEFIKQTIIVQATACFTAPVIAYFDLSGKITRNLIAKSTSVTQEELNSKFNGSDWSLADKYTAIAKILFVSIYYALLTPMSLLMSLVAFSLTFFVDRFLLLRRWKQVPMIDEDLSIRFRQQSILCIAAHMYISMRFIYSWPMDQAYFNEELGVFEKVNKYPSVMIVQLNVRDWHSAGQRAVLPWYRALTLLMLSCVVIIWVIIPVYLYLRQLWCYQLKRVGESQGISFSCVHNISIYEPVVQFAQNNYRCSACFDVLNKHRAKYVIFDHQLAGQTYDRPETAVEEHVTNANADENSAASLYLNKYEESIDLSRFVPAHHRVFVLSIVKQFPINDLEQATLLATTALGKNLSLLGPAQATKEVELQGNPMQAARQSTAGAGRASDISQERLEKLREARETRDDLRSSTAASAGLPASLLSKIQSKPVRPALAGSVANSLSASTNNPRASRFNAQNNYRRISIDQSFSAIGVEDSREVEVAVEEEESQLFAPQLTTSPRMKGKFKGKFQQRGV